MHPTSPRCRPGDLAVVLRGTYAGAIVNCIALALEGERASFDIADNNGPVWRIDRCMLWNSGDGKIPLPYAPDSALLPIGPPPDAGTHKHERRKRQEAVE